MPASGFLPSRPSVSGTPSASAMSLARELSLAFQPIVIPLRWYMLLWPLTCNGLKLSMGCMELGSQWKWRVFKPCKECVLKVLSVAVLCPFCNVLQDAETQLNLSSGPDGVPA